MRVEAFGYIGTLPPTKDPTQSPTPAPTNNPTPSPTVNPTLAPSPAGDAFSIIFISDMECEYRRHTNEMCYNVINWVKNIAHEGFTFDGEFNTIPVKPDLVIHGGDLSDGNHGTWAKQGSGAADYLFSNVWQQLYDAGIPMISALGNHDYAEQWSKQPAEKWPVISQQANKFVLDSYDKTKDLLGDDFEFNEFRSTESLHAPSLFKSKFHQLQIVNLNYYALYKQNEMQFYTLSNSLEYDKKTIFFGHVPIYEINTLKDDVVKQDKNTSNTTFEEVKKLIQKFDNTIYVSGHDHWKHTKNYSGFTDYIAAYPHLWEQPGGSGNYLDAGMYAILVSPTSGVLQVKNILIPYEQISGCWADGTVCGVKTTCGQCCREARLALGTQCGGGKWPDGTICGLGTTCGLCQNKASAWDGKGFACGTDCYVTFYEDSSYGGISYGPITIGKYTPVPNISSLTVSGANKCCVKIYEDANYEGMSNIYCNQDVPYVGNDWKMSSFELYINCGGQCSNSQCCENGQCVSKQEDWAGVYYCPAECRGG
eukprot:425082_1